MNRRIIILLIGVWLLAAFTPAAACPTCYGQAEGPMIDGMNKAILTMIGIIGFVLTGFVALFVSIGRRIKHYNAAIAGNAPGAANTEKGAA